MAELGVSVDHDLCVGSTMCIQRADGVFDLNDEGQSVVTDLEGASREEIVDAASQCPMEAITVVDSVSGEQLFP